jgi:cell division protease FtsH
VAAPSSSGGVAMKALVDAEVQNIINEGYATARAILTEHADQLKVLADALLEHEQINRSQFEALLK